MTKAAGNMPRVLGYGRLSFDDPDRKTSSVADQEAGARRYAERLGWQIARFHSDEGITGATMERPGLQALLAAVRARQADIVVIEDVDRLGRDQEHLQYMAKLFRAYAVKLHAVAIGPVEDLVLAVKGLVAEEQRRRIAYTTRRGLVGKARRGGATGGKTLGYERVVTGISADGEELDRYVPIEAEAATVLRAFKLYASGQSLKAICALFDAEGVPTPGANWKRRNKTNVWNPSSLSGNVERGEGILNNRAYIGERVFNRRAWVEVPTEARGFKRQPRINDRDDWVVNHDPEQRIVPQDLWDAVKARQVEMRAARDAQFKLSGNPLSGAHRPGHLLSELVYCGACGERFVATGAGRWRCRNHRGHACTNGSVTTRELEERVLTGIRERLLTPPLIARFAAELQRELEDAQRDQGASRRRIEVELTDTRGRIATLVRRIEENDNAPRSLVARLKELEATEARLATELTHEPTPTVVRLPANAEALYARAVAELEAHLAGSDGTAARDAIRALVERVVVQPGDARGGKRRPMQLEGDLFGMLAFAERVDGGGRIRQQPRSCGTEAVVLSLVAGTGFEPVTFRL